MSRSEQAIFTNMCMVCGPQGEILVQERLGSDWPGIAFPGGHVEPGESFVDSVIRELREETGLTLHQPRLCGIKQFPTQDGARYVVLLFRADQFSGEIRSSREGRVFWVKRENLMRYPLAENFAETLKVFESDTLNEDYWHHDERGWHEKLL